MQAYTQHAHKDASSVLTEVFIWTRNTCTDTKRTEPSCWGCGLTPFKSIKTKFYYSHVALRQSMPPTPAHTPPHLTTKLYPTSLVDPLKWPPERAPTDKLMERWKEGGRAKGTLIKDQSKEEGKRENVMCVCELGMERVGGWGGG